VLLIRERIREISRECFDGTGEVFKTLIGDTQLTHSHFLVLTLMVRIP